MPMERVGAFMFYLGIAFVAWGLSFWSLAVELIFIGFVLVVMSLAAYKSQK